MEADHGQSPPSDVVLMAAIIFLLVVGTGCVAPVAHRFVVEGDVMIGAIFSMHKASWSYDLFYLHASICIKLFSIYGRELYGLCRLTFILEVTRHSFPKITSIDSQI